jgi:hypothetical protein
LAFVSWPLGEVRKAYSIMDEALAEARHGQHIPTMAIAHGLAVPFYSLCRDTDRAIMVSEITMSLARQHGLPLFVAAALIGLGWAQWWNGDSAGETDAPGGIGPSSSDGFSLLPTA